MGFSLIFARKIRHRINDMKRVVIKLWEQKENIIEIMISVFVLLFLCVLFLLQLGMGIIFFMAFFDTLF
jgi:hypothetical protein